MSVENSTGQNNNNNTTFCCIYVASFAFMLVLVMPNVELLHHPVILDLMGA